MPMAKSRDALADGTPKRAAGAPMPVDRTVQPGPTGTSQLDPQGGRQNPAVPGPDGQQAEVEPARKVVGGIRAPPL